MSRPLDSSDDSDGSYVEYLFTVNDKQSSDDDSSAHSDGSFVEFLYTVNNSSASNKPPADEDTNAVDLSASTSEEPLVDVDSDNVKLSATAPKEPLIDKDSENAKSAATSKEPLIDEESEKGPLEESVDDQSINDGRHPPTVSRKRRIDEIAGGDDQRQFDNIVEEDSNNDGKYATASLKRPSDKNSPQILDILRSKMKSDLAQLARERRNRLSELLDQAQQALPSRPKGRPVSLPRTFGNTCSDKKEHKRTTFTLSRVQPRVPAVSVRHTFCTLDSSPVNVSESKMPTSVARVLVDETFTNIQQDEGHLDFVPSQFLDTEEEEKQKWTDMFNSERRQRKLNKGPQYKREEADRIVSRALTRWKNISCPSNPPSRIAGPALTRSPDLLKLTNVMVKLFAGKYYEPDLRLKVKKFVEDPTSLSVPVFAASEEEEPAGNPIVEKTYPTLEGNDPDYLEAVSFSRCLYCQVCKEFQCNRHLELGYGRSSLQMQYEVAMAEERHRRVTMKSFPEPVYDERTIPRRLALDSFQKSICRRLFLIYEGDLEKVAIFLNVRKELVADYCRNFQVPRTRKLIKKEEQVPSKNDPKWYSLSIYRPGVYRKYGQTNPHERDAFYPCFHDNEKLPCEHPKSGCSCVKNNRFCTRNCCRGLTSSNFFRGCDCKGSCDSSQCSCRDSGMECDPSLCMCDTCSDPAGKPATAQKCLNDNMTMKRRRPTYVGLSLIEGAGFGLFTRFQIPKGAYIDEYIGEQLSSDEAERRGYIYDLKGDTSLFLVNRDLELDGTRLSGHMRFVNCSATPNAESRSYAVNGDSRIGFFALQDIPAQTELTIEYNFEAAKMAAANRNTDH